MRIPYLTARQDTGPISFEYDLRFHNEIVDTEGGRHKNAFSRGVFLCPCRSVLRLSTTLCNSLETIKEEVIKIIEIRRAIVVIFFMVLLAVLCPRQLFFTNIQWTDNGDYKTGNVLDVNLTSTKPRFVH